MQEYSDPETVEAAASARRTGRELEGVGVDEVPGSGDVVDVNGEPTSIAPGCTVAQLLESLGMRDRRVAVARNRHVVSRSEYASVSLEPGDRIEILEAVGGG